MMVLIDWRAPFSAQIWIVESWSSCHDDSFESWLRQLVMQTRKVVFKRLLGAILLIRRDLHSETGLRCQFLARKVVEIQLLRYELCNRVIRFKQVWLRLLLVYTLFAHVLFLSLADPWVCIHHELLLPVVLLPEFTGRLLGELSEFRRTTGIVIRTVCLWEHKSAAAGITFSSLSLEVFFNIMLVISHH